MRKPDFSRIERICPGYTLAPIQDLRGFQRCVDLQVRVWNYDDAADVVPMALLAITNHNGGLLLGARDRRGALIGFVYSILGFHHGHLVQHSHMLGVLAGHRNRNIGLALKLAQRQSALQQGVRRIVWTYDPLQSLNAHFNFNNLGVWVDTYEVNIYGRSSSLLHRGLDTDRFFACWDLDSLPVRRKVRQALQSRIAPVEVPDLPVINRLQQPGGALPGPPGSPFLFEIPSDIHRLKQEDLPAARRVQAQLRGLCLRCFRKGFRITGFLTDAGSVYHRCFYLFSPGKW